MLTTKEAADRLGVSTARVRQLVERGQVKAWRKGRTWLIDEDSLAEHAEHSRPGRPSRESTRWRSAVAGRQFVLMSRDHEVAYCSYSDAEKRFVKLEVVDERRVPLALLSYKRQDNGLAALNHWWKDRAIPLSRDSMPTRMREIGAETTFEIPLRSLGLSLTDQYWLRPADGDLNWSGVSFFRNSFEMGGFDFDEMNRSRDVEWLNAVGLNSPDNTTDGMLRKRWMLDESERRVLIKSSGPSGREAFNEVIATMLYRRLLPSSRYVEYRLGQWRGQDVSVCETFLRDDEEFVSAWYVCQLRKKRNNHSLYRHYCETCESLGARHAENQLARMLVCDSILANTDRHMGNFGLIRNVETLEWRVAPIFDSGTSLWTHKTVRELVAGDYAFETKPFHKKAKRQLDIVPDATWYHPEALDGFVDEVRDFINGLYPTASPADLICKGIERRIDTVNIWARRAPSNKLPAEYAAQTETLDWVWL